MPEPEQLFDLYRVRNEIECKCSNITTELNYVLQYAGYMRDLNDDQVQKIVQALHHHVSDALVAGKKASNLVRAMLHGIAEAKQAARRRDQQINIEQGWLDNLAIDANT